MMAKLLIAAGLLLVGLGLALMAGLPLGRLPGDITVQRGSFTFYFPLATCIVVSLVLTLLFSLLRR
jgi:predicted MFS family arabinose efflux permease